MTRSSVKERDRDAKMQDSSDMIPFRDTSRVFFSFLQRSPRPVIGRGRPTPPLNGRAATGYRTGCPHPVNPRARAVKRVGR
jgi:hypothetical protein